MNTHKRHHNLRNRLLFTLLLIALALLAAAPARTQSREVIVLDIEGPVTPVMANYFARGLETAVREEAEALVIVMDTPGGAVNTTIEIVQLFRNASVPVIVFIGPQGAQAASAGSVITAAAHVAVMAPQTIIGAASPINSDGSDINETAYRKAVEDLKATMRAITDRRGPEAVALAEAMIEEARAVTAQEALDAGFIDAVSNNVPALLADIDGMTVSVNDTPVTLQTANAVQQPVSLNVVEQILFILANPLLVGVLLAIGAQAIIFEITNPGGWAAGLIGVILIALAMFGLGQLPVNWLGLGLIVLAFVLFVAEAATQTSGPLAIGGGISLLAGLLVLFNSPGTPEYARISLLGALSITLATSGFFVFLVAKVVQTRRTQPATGAEGMIGQMGRARAPFKADEAHGNYRGTVLLMGEIWRAVSDEPVDGDEDVLIKSIDGFTLKIKRMDG